MIDENLLFKTNTMSFLKQAFSFKRTKARKDVSKNPLKLSTEESCHEFGPICNIIDVKIADRKIFFNTDNGNWNTENAEIFHEISNDTADRIRKHIQILQEENNILKVKIEVLFNLITESIAEWVSMHR
ncbi:hypothetical protein I4U23_026719 [Adineta vaga]|nr:hypothetical protein I4U23_026719 [Adineta vaga]